MPGTEGLVHISELKHGRTEKTEDVVKRGDRVRVKLLDRDERGRLRLSMKALLPPPEGGADEGGNGGSREGGRERGGRPREERERASVSANTMDAGESQAGTKGHEGGEREEGGGRPRRGRGGRSRR